MPTGAVLPFWLKGTGRSKTATHGHEMPCLSRKVFFPGCGRRMPSNSYRVTLQRQTVEDQFGIVITYTKRGEGLLIKDVGRESAVLQWSQEHPEHPIRIGCAILSINGESQIEPMLEQLHTSCKLEMVITRDLTANQQQTLQRSLQKTVPSFLVESLPRVCENHRHAGDVCAICCEDLDGTSPVQLPCGHAFHAPCVKTWLVTRSRRCPLCNREVELNRAGDPQLPRALQEASESLQ